MPDIRALFWDVGGVLLTNGWDAPARREAASRFDLDWEDFETRHQMVVADFEKGRICLDEYLVYTVFCEPRPFSKDEFQSCMFDQSKPIPETLGVAERLAHSGKYLMATLNNESAELNLHRIEKFNLRAWFSIFFSSCFLGMVKPDAAIYRLALRMTQLPPGRCVVIDDREVNLESARRLGMQTIHYRDSAGLHDELRRNGVVLKADRKEKYARERIGEPRRT